MITDWGKFALALSLCAKLNYNMRLTSVQDKIFSKIKYNLSILIVKNSQMTKFGKKTIQKLKSIVEWMYTKNIQRGAHTLKKLQKKLRLLTLVLLAGLLFSSVTLTARAYIQKDGTVNTAVTLRQDADANSNQVLELSVGQKVTVNNEITNADGTKWYQVFLDATLGYVPANTVTIGDSSTGSGSTTTQTQTKTETITVTERIATVAGDSAIRVRERATTDSTQIASMKVGDKGLVLENENGSDGHVWYKIEFDDNGKTVYGYVRSDLVSVEEVTSEKQVQVEVPVTPTESPSEEAPYSITSQKNAEGVTVWYLLDGTTGDANEISSLLSGAVTEVKSGGGAYKVLVVLFLILVIVAAGAATFFYMRWQEAEAFIDELHEKQLRGRKPAAQQTRTAPVQKTESKPATATAKPAGTGLPPLKTSGQSVSQPVNRPAAQPLNKPVNKPVAQPVSKPVSKPAESVLPHTADIVNATKKELQEKQTNVAPAQSGSWKSKNFLTDDDDLEFDFLDMDEK